MLSYELRDKIVSYIDEEITLAQLEEWYVPRLSSFLELPASDDADVIAAVEMCLAELAGGLIDESEARSSLKETLDRVGNTVSALVVADGYLISTITGSRSQVQKSPVAAFNPVFSFATR